MRLGLICLPSSYLARIQMDLLVKIYRIICWMDGFRTATLRLDLWIWFGIRSYIVCGSHSRVETDLAECIYTTIWLIMLIISCYNY